MPQLRATVVGFARGLWALLRGLQHALGTRGVQVAGLCLLILLPLGYLLGTEHGRVSLTRGAFYGAEQVIAGLRIEAEGMRSESLGAWFVDRLRIEFKRKTLAEAHQLELKLQRFSRDPIDIERIAAKNLLINLDVLTELLKLTQTGQDTVQTAGLERDPDKVEAWDSLLPGVRLGQLQCGRVQLIHSKIAEIPAVSVHASALYQWEGQPAQLQLVVRAFNDGKLQLIAKGREQPSGRFVLDFSVHENARGFVSRRLHLPGQQQLNASGVVSLRRRDEQLQVDIESFTTPFSRHKLGLTGSLAISRSPWRMSTEGILLYVDGRRNSLTGSFSTENISAHLHLNRLPVTLSRPWQDVLHSGWLSADLKLTGAGMQPDVTGQLQLRSRYREQPLGLTGRVSTRRGTIQLESVQLSFAGARMVTTGQVDTTSKTLNLTAVVPELAVEEMRRLMAALPYTDRVEIPAGLSASLHQLQVTAQGPWQNPDLEGVLRVAAVYRNLHSELHIGVHGNRRELIIRDLALVGNKLNIHGGGTIGIEAKALNVQLEIDLRALDPGHDLGLVLAEDMTVSMQGAVAVQGPWSNPYVSASLESGGRIHAYDYTLKGDATGNLEKIDLKGFRLEVFANDTVHHFDQGQSPGAQMPATMPGLQKGFRQSAQGQNPLMSLVEEAQRLEREGMALLEAEGVIEPMQGRIDVNLSARNLPISLVGVVGLTLPDTLKGALSLDGEIQGALSYPQVRGTVFAQGDYSREPWQLQGQLDYADNRWILNGLELLWAGRNQLSAHGSLNKQRLDFQLQGRAALADLSPRISVDMPERGDISLFAAINGSPQNPQLQGELRISGEAPGRAQGRIRAQPFTLLLEWGTQEGALSINLTGEHGGRQAIDSRAKLEITPIFAHLFSNNPVESAPDAMPLLLTGGGTANLSVVGEFIDPRVHNVRGLVHFTVDSKGTFAHPNLTGAIEMRAGSYEHRPTHTRIANIDFYVRLLPGQWRIERGSATDGDGGTIHLDGAVLLPVGAPPEFNLVLHLARAHLLNTPAVRGAISGNVALSGTTEDAAMRGRLVLRPLSLQIEQWIGSSIPEIQVVEIQAGGARVTPSVSLLRRIGLGIEVVLDQQSYVRGLGLNSQLSGLVDIHGTAARPAASGALTIVRGSFDLLGKKFDLQEGEIRFENNAVAVSVAGVYEYSDGEITAQISGSATDLDITFSSNPAASQDEILAQLLFGKSLSNILPLQAVRLVSVVRSLQTGRTVLDPVAKTRELLRLDTLDIEQEDSDEGDAYALSLGKYITNRIYVELQRSTDPLSPWQAEMQIELRDNLNLQFQTADEGDSGSGSVELHWKKEY
ncbi:translocation/assembly module TamB domain-containing protein [Microbulbifer sp. 2304DJ12-6]|uniref:translocation/assembly module TamB domain-containing protein n=1 Tax=Microbulbifer sp. 2304DJ12-6 TaxID=3233340 RepID=UPI0039AFECDF